MKIGTSDIIKMYKGTTEITKAYLGTVPMYEGNGGIDEHTVLMCHFDDNTADASANAITPTTQGTITYGIGKFSKAITGGTLTYSDASMTDITKSTGKFTVDFWMPKIEGCAGTMYFRNSNNTTVFKICRNISGDVLSLTETGVACDIDISGITANEWFHLALVNDGQFDPDNSSYRIFPVYLNGVFQKNLKYSKTNLSGSGKIYTQITTAPIDELRVSDIVRYTGNFTPPTQPYS